MSRSPPAFQQRANHLISVYHGRATWGLRAVPSCRWRRPSTIGRTTKAHRRVAASSRRHVIMSLCRCVVVSWCCCGASVVVPYADVRVRCTVLSVLTTYLDVQTTSLFHHTVSVSKQARVRPASSASSTVFPSCTARRSSFVVRRSSLLRCCVVVCC